ncbi:MAG: hypothetical protein LBQ60_14775 [Bacteroidales bacterium]|jgi:hypothetical protein|nr:hypothetical protein [Bacteroidales bacterium]
MKKTLLIPCLFSLMFISCSVSHPFAENQLADFQHYGYVIDQSGQRIDGLLELNAYGNLWFNQSKIGFCPQTEIDKAKGSGKSKVRSQWYKASDLQGYGYGSKKFVTKKVRLGTGMQWRMLEVLSVQQKTYKFYNSGESPSKPDRYSVLKENANGELEQIR